MASRPAALHMCLLFLLDAASPAIAQVGFSEISGGVRDSSGAPVAGATYGLAAIP